MNRVSIGLIDQHEWEGGRLYTENLARALMFVPEHEVNLVWFGDDRTLHSDLKGIRRVRISHHGKLARLREASVAAKHASLDFLYPFPGRVGNGVSSAHWIPDLQHIAMPQMFNVGTRVRRDVLFRLSATIAPAVIVSSKASKADLMGMTRLARPERLHVLNFATPLESGDIDDFSVEAKLLLNSLPDAFAYLPNQMWKHKDHPTALLAIARLRDDGYSIPLVLTGDPSDSRSPEWSKYVMKLAAELDIEHLLIFLGRLPRNIQLAVLRAARVVVQPSLFEGWSTVVEDARALGKTICLSRITPHVEQAPPFALYFEPGDPVDLAASILAAWTTEQSAKVDLSELVTVAQPRVTAVGRHFLGIVDQVRGEAAR